MVKSKYKTLGEHCNRHCTFALECCSCGVALVLEEGVQVHWMLGSEGYLESTLPNDLSRPPPLLQAPAELAPFLPHPPAAVVAVAPHMQGSWGTAQRAGRELKRSGGT